MDSVPQEKLCRRCGTVKPLTAFRKASKEKDGHQYTCKDCRKPLECSAAYLETLRLEALGLQVCRVCGVVKPFSDFGKFSIARNGYKYDCKACRHVDRLRSYAAKREYNCAINRAYYWANRERCIASVVRAHKARWEQTKQQMYRWRRENPDKVKSTGERYRKRNYAKILERNRRRSARKRGVSIVPFTMEQLQAKLAYWGHCCWMCGGIATAVDHVKPLAKGGLHVLANLRPACKPCNSRKSDTWPYP